MVEFLVEHKSDLQAGLKHWSLSSGCPRHIYIYIYILVYIYIFLHIMYIYICMDSRLLDEIDIVLLIYIY